MRRDAVASASRLGFRYGESVVLRNVNFELQRGEVFGLLGPNGAGKTTALRLLLGLLPPSSGDVTLFGVRPQEKPHLVGPRIGVVLEDNPLVEPRWSVREYLTYFGWLEGLSGRESEQRLAALCGSLGLPDRVAIGTFSHGNRRKLQLARAMLHRPELLVLDEPSLGLDLPTKHELWRLLRAQAARGTTLVLSSHEQDEIRTLCDRVGVLVHGALAGPFRPHPGGDPKAAIVSPPVARHLAPADGRVGPVELPVTPAALRGALAAALRSEGATGEVAFGATMSDTLAIALPLLGFQPAPGRRTRFERVAPPEGSTGAVR